MDLPRLKKVLAGLSVGAIMLTQVSSVFAAYKDVPAGSWFEEAVTSFSDAGYLDAAQSNFRPTDTANRAEFVKLVVELNGGILSTPPAVPTFDDVKASAWYYGYMEEAAKELWVKGDGNCVGTHPCYGRPAANISRAEAAALIVRAFALESTGDASQFVDNPSGQWYTQSIQIAADHCVLQGDSTTGRVRPTDNMNRAEMVVMLNRVDQGLVYGTDCGGGQTNPSTPALSSVTATSTSKAEAVFNVAVDEAAAETLANYALTPAVTISSATLVSEKTVELVFSEALTSGKEYTLTVSNMKTKDGKTFSDSGKLVGYSSLPQGNGTLEISVSSKNPSGDTVPMGANQVTMLSLDLTASCDDSVTVESITVLHEGFGAKSDITGVYAMADGGRVSRERSISSTDQTATIRFITPLVVPACKTTTVDLVADFNTGITAGAEHNLAVELASDFLSNAKGVTGSFPLRGGSFKVGAVTSGVLTLTYRSVTPSQVEVGDKGKVIGRFEVSTNSVEDQTIYTMTIHQNGTVGDGDVSNIKIRRTDGTVLTNVVPQFNNKFATLTFNPPFVVLEGDKLTLEVVADVVGGAAKTVVTDFDETSDIFAVGSLYGYGVNGQLYGSKVVTSGTASSLTVDAGQFTIEINGPSQQSYTRDQDDAVLANVVFTSGGETVNIQKLWIAVQAQTVTGSALVTGRSSTSYDEIEEVLSNVTLRNAATGTSLEGTPETASTAHGDATGSVTASYQIYRFDDFTVSGKETWQLKVDFTDNGSGQHPRNGDQFKAIICGEPINTATTTVGCTFGGLITEVETWNMDIEGLSTGDDVTDVRPGGNIVSNTQRVADASLTVTEEALTATDRAVKNAKNVRLMRITMRSGEAKNLLVTKLVLDSADGTEAHLKNGTNYALWVDTDNDGNVDTIIDKNKGAEGSTTYTVTFDTITNGGFVISKEQTVAFEVHADIAGALTDSSLQVRLNDDSAESIEVETVDRGSNLSSSDISLTTGTSPLFTLVNQGNLFVTKDTTQPSNQQLLAGSLGNEILRLDLRSEDEPIDVTSIALSSSGSTATGVYALELYKLGATTPFALATTNGCGSDDVPTRHFGVRISTFCAKMQTQQLVVPKNDEVKVIVRPRLKSDNDTNSPTGQILALFIDPNGALNDATGTGSVRARGVDSSGTLGNNRGGSNGTGSVILGATASTSVNAIMFSKRNDIVTAKIASITNANPDANGTAVPTGADAAIGRFTFTAATNTNSKNALNKATLSGVIFTISATNVDLESSGFKWYNASNATSAAKVACTALNSSLSSSGALKIQCLDTTAINTEIASGQSQTFVLEADIDNSVVTAGSTSTLQVSLQNFSDINHGRNFSQTASNISWIDDDDATGSTQFMWVEYPDTTIKSTSYTS